MDHERNEGRAEGIELGEEKGRQEERKKAHEEKLASVRSLKALGLTCKQISDSLGLTEEEVEKA